MKSIAGRAFAHIGSVRLLGPQGREQAGRGIIARRRGQPGGMAGEGHQLGKLENPLYVFTGDLEEARPGDILEARCGERYRVLQAETVALGDTAVCLRAVLEREGAEDDSL